MAINDIFTIHEINLDIKDLSYDIKAKELETYWNKECSELPIINHCKIFAINTSTFRYSYAWFLHNTRTKEYLDRKEGKQMTNLGIEILFWTILISYLGLRFSQTWNGFKKQY